MIDTPPERQIADCDVFFEASHTGSENDTWAFAILPGARGWSFVKSFPIEILCELGTASQQIRFLSLCRLLKCVGFQLNIYDSGPGLLIEVTELGDSRISGYTYSGDPFDLYGYRLDPTNYNMAFSLLPYQELISGCCDDLEGVAEVISRRFGGINSKLCDNITSIEHLFKYTKLSVTDGCVCVFKDRVIIL